MVRREKMSRQERAKQFAPFDALKGLKEAIMIKEFEHEKISKNEMSEEQVKIISDVLLNLQKNDEVEIEFYRDGHIVRLVGKAQVEPLEGVLKVGSFVIDFIDIREIRKK